MKILVTGATGLIGSHIAEKLLAQKQDVRILVRDPQKASFLKETGAELVLGDTLDPDTLQRALNGVDTVYHCAALVQLQGTRDRLLNINVQGTRNMLEASLAANVKRFVFTSSVAVYGSANDPNGTREDDPQTPNGSYSESKIESEKLVWQAYREKGLLVSIIRPCVVYGPRDLNFSRPLLKNLKGTMPMVRHGEALLDLVHVRDVADVHLLAGTNEKAIGQAYNVTDGETHTIQELVQTVRRLANLDTTFINLPYPLVLGGAALAHAFARMQGKTPLLSPATVRAMAIHHHYSIAKAREQLGFVPSVQLEEGWKETIAWFQARSR